MAHSTFQRFENKYLLTKQEYTIFFEKIAEYIEKDKYFSYLVSNLYLDTDNYRLIRHSIEKPVYKEKIRLRSYFVPSQDDNVFLEVKRKYNKLGSKRRISIKLSEFEAYMQSGIAPEGKGQVMQELDYTVKYYGLKPKLYLAYNRQAYTGKFDKNLRITVDTRITSRTYDLSLSRGSYGTELLSPDYYLLEIKVADAFPLWLVKILSENKIYPVSFSKYGEIYKKQIHKNT